MAERAQDGVHARERSRKHTEPPSVPELIEEQ
jgi:hypothetical protein